VQGDVERHGVGGERSGIAPKQVAWELVEQETEREATIGAVAPVRELTGSRILVNPAEADLDPAIEFRRRFEPSRLAGLGKPEVDYVARPLRHVRVPIAVDHHPDRCAAGCPGAIIGPRPVAAIKVTTSTRAVIAWPLNGGRKGPSR
jgi:hypothetical protein